MMPARTLAAMTVDLNFITVSFLCGLGERPAADWSKSLRAAYFPIRRRAVYETAHFDEMPIFRDQFADAEQWFFRQSQMD